MDSLVGLLVVALLAVLAWMWNSYATAGGVTRGLASGMDLVESLSPTHARRRGLYTRPNTRITWRTPLREVGIEIGRTQGLVKRTVAATVEDVVLFIAGPRTGKSGRLACYVQDAPGAELVTSTRPDLWRNSIKSRHLRPVWVFNPKGVGVTDNPTDPGPVSNLRWSPVLASVDIASAWLIAALHVSAGATGGQKESEYWEHNATTALRLLLAAAHCGERDMHDVYAWVRALDNPDVMARPIGLLDTVKGRARFPGWAAELRNLSEKEPKPLDSIANTAGNCIDYMADRDLAHAATPGTDEHFTPDHFLATGGTLYVIGAHEEQSPVGPLFSTFIGFLYEHARQVAAASVGNRLDPPLTLVLDEATSTFRTPLPRWTSDAGGYGIPIIIAIQGRHQLREAFGEDGAATIWQNATTKIILGGQMDPDTVRDISTLSGDRAAEIGSMARRPVLEPADIKNLPEGVALVLHRNIRPVRVRVQMVWQRRRPPVAEPLVVVEQSAPSAEVVVLADHMRKGA